MTFKILFFLLSILFLSCNNQGGKSNKFIGSWYDTDYIIPSNANIKINSNNTFNYKSRGCQWSVISKGEWKINGDSIELNSIRIDTCYSMYPFIECLTFGENLNKNAQKTIPNCVIKSDTHFAVFSKEIFYLKNDSLVYKLKVSSNCPNKMKIIYAKAQRKYEINQNLKILH